MVSPEPPDEALYEQVAHGDRRAFARLAERHRRRLMALAVRVVADRAAAEDVVQEALTRAWVQAPRWRADGAGTVGAWLTRVAVNLAIDQARRPRLVPLDDVASPTDPTEPADERLIRAERGRRLQAAMVGLPERQRAALALTYDAELSNAEGARAMATSVGAFELLLVRARRALRLALSEDQP